MGGGKELKINMNIKNKKQLSNDTKWYNNFSKIQRFIQQNGRCPANFNKDKSEASLAKWLYHQRYLIKLNKLPKDRLTNFQKIISNRPIFDKIWQQSLKMTIQFIKKNNRIPSNHISKEKYLSLWYYRQYTDYRKGTLNQQRKILLDASGILTYKFQKDVWKERYNAFSDFIVQNKRSPNSRSKGDEKTLADWYTRNKSRLKKDKLSSEKALLMQNLIHSTPKRKDWINATWTRHFNKLKFFKLEHKRLPESTAKAREELGLYYWLSDQKKYYRQNILSAEQINKLKLLSSETFNFKEYAVNYKDKQIQQWFTKYGKVKIFLKQHNRFPITFKKSEEERHLGDWCRYQKKQHHRGKLSDERHKLLEDIGFNFEWILK